MRQRTGLAFARSQGSLSSAAGATSDVITAPGASYRQVSGHVSHMRMQPSNVLGFVIPAVSSGFNSSYIAISGDVGSISTHGAEC